MRFSTFVLVLLFASWTFALPLPGTPTEAVPYPSPRSAKNPPAAKPPHGAKPPNTAKPPTGQPPAAKAPAAKPPTGKPPGGKSPLGKIGSIFHPHEDKFSFNFHGFRSVEDPISQSLTQGSPGSTAINLSETEQESPTESALPDPIVHPIVALAEDSGFF